MESAGRLRHQEPHPARAASEPAPSDAYVGNPGGLPGTQERRRTRHPNALARVAISRTPHRHVETPRSYGALATCVQPKIWVTISPGGEGGERSEPGEGLLRYVCPPRSPARATDPSPVPRRLVKTPVAGHPLPKGEGCASDFGPPHCPVPLPKQRA